jgi:hypothetical protein
VPEEAKSQHCQKPIKNGRLRLVSVQQVIVCGVIGILWKMKKNPDGRDEHEFSIIHVSIHAMSDRENTP